MKTASLVFTILGMIGELYICTYTNWALGAAGLVVGAFMISSLCTNKKNISIGILGIIFTGILGGIFYLCWDPE